MFLSEPGQTGYDIQFSLFGFPVRVHPLFFLAPLLFGQGLIHGYGANAGVSLLVVTVVFFVSILLHELGHSLAYKWFGINSRIVLHWMGGLAIADRGTWIRKGGLRSNQQIVVSLAGPITNVLLALAMLGIGLKMGGRRGWWQIFVPIPGFTFDGTAFGGKPYLQLLFDASIKLNFLWAMFNMLPVFPLDGGQVARAFMEKIDPRDGMQNSLYLSMGVAGLLCVYGLSIQDLFIAIFCGYMAYESWQSLQRLSGRRW